MAIVRGRSNGVAKHPRDYGPKLIGNEALEFIDRHTGSTRSPESFSGAKRKQGN